jgi:hypothetical protein
LGRIVRGFLLAAIEIPSSGGMTAIAAAATDATDGPLDGGCIMISMGIFSCSSAILLSLLLCNDIPFI